MRYWWVNQNQTYRQEVGGGYLWSPKRKSNDAHNPFYEFMREVSPSDLILSFRDTYIRNVGIAQSYCYESPKPTEFGPVGANWGAIGWKVDVRYVQLTNVIRPKDHMNVLVSHLPARYSPLRPNGNGLQSVYLTEIPPPLMEVLADLIGAEARNMMAMSLQHQELPRYGTDPLAWEERLESILRSDNSVPETEREQLVMARRGQGQFKENVRLLEQRCRVTGVDRLEHLRASHIKPWRHAGHDERLDGENGFLLTPSIDHLFDRGFISFEDSGRLIISPSAHRASLQRMGVAVDQSVNVGQFSEGQRRYLEFHRDDVFLEARNRK